MFCGKCGKKLEDNAKFCGHCGAKIELENEEIHQVVSVEPQKKRKRKSSKNMWVFVTILVLVVIVAGTIYATLGLNMKKDKLVSKIKDSQIEEYIHEEKEISKKWELYGITDINRKKHVIENLEDVCTKIENFEKEEQELQALEKGKKSLKWEEENFAKYELALSECEKAFKIKDVKKAKALLKEAKKAKNELEKSNEAFIKERVEMYEGLNLEDADANVVTEYEKNLKEIKKLVKAEKKENKKIKKAFEKMDQSIFMYLEPKNLLDVKVQQVDVSRFPKIKLYVNMQDMTENKVPKHLKKDFCYVKKEDSSAQLKEQTVTVFHQLDEKDALKINMVADVSSNMKGTPLKEAKSAMKNFLNRVQFQAGDLVELTSFADGVHLEQEFSSDLKELSDKIDSLETGNMTSLYDALYTSVERVATQDGARCVIAFSCGNDNNSNCIPQDVISVSKRYHVPIFIIGIGASGSSEIRRIANETGGIYYNVDQAKNMEEIYDEIYGMEKELYLVEFEDTTGETVKNQAKFLIEYHSLEYGGECDYLYTPNILLNSNSTAVYQEGPEAVVENYLRNFPKAMTNSDFSLISPYLKQGSPIYVEQEKYVKRGIAERLDSYEITAIENKGENQCIISTRETFYVQLKGQPLKLMTQECQYLVEKQENTWKMTAFVDLKVTSKIKQ